MTIGMRETGNDPISWSEGRIEFFVLALETQ